MTPSHAMLAIDRSRAPQAMGAEISLPEPVLLQWTSHAMDGGRTAVHLMLSIEFVSNNAAMVEAWLERDDRANQRQCLIPRTRMNAEVAEIDGLLHIDVYGNGHDDRIAAITLLAGKTPMQRPLFAQACVLMQAGFTRGGCDSPRLVRSLPD